MSGEITVTTRRDDDFIGFVLGYQSDELNSAFANFWRHDGGVENIQRATNIELPIE